MSSFRWNRARIIAIFGGGLGLWLALALPAPTLASDHERITVSFVNPGRSDEGFWTSVTAFMQAAAEDLNVDLRVEYGERDRLRMNRLAMAAVMADPKPDYLVLVNEAESAQGVLEAARDNGVKVFVLLNGFTGNDIARYGKPREKFANWVGSMIPDNASAGRAIAKAITEAAVRAGAVGADGKVHAAAISGDKVTPASLHRDRGLAAFARDDGRLLIYQHVYGKWRRDRALVLTLGLLKRYPKLNAIWAANDPMALGAIEAARAVGRTPGRDVFIAGLNWSVEALNSVIAGDMEVSVGGHFMAGGWSLVLLRDYHDGLDFAAAGGTVFGLDFGVLDRHNTKRYLDLFGDSDWSKIDFQKFSMSHKGKGVEYDFSPKALLETAAR